jgi:hypothetical protein
MPAPGSASRRRSRPDHDRPQAALPEPARVGPAQVLVPVSRLYGGGLYFPGELAADILHTWWDWTTTLPDDLTTSVALLRLPLRHLGGALGRPAGPTSSAPPRAGSWRAWRRGRPAAPT